MKIITIFFLLLASFVHASDNYYYQNNKQIKLTPVNSILRSNTNIDYYVNDKKILIGVSDKLIVKFYESSNLQKYLLEFNATVEKVLDVNLYLLKVKDKKSTLDVTNKLSEKEDIEYAHPDFLKTIKQR